MSMQSLDLGKSGNLQMVWGKDGRWKVQGVTLCHLDPCFWYIYLREWLIFVGNGGKYAIHGLGLLLSSPGVCYILLHVPFLWGELN